MKSNTIGDYLEQYICNDDTIEIRAITPNKKKLQAAYVSRNNIDTIVSEIIELSNNGYNIYTNQLLLPDDKYPTSSFRRRNQYFKQSHSSKRITLPIDIDPIRPTQNGLKQSSTAKQRTHAVDIAHKIQSYMDYKYGLQTITANSGNGAYVLSRLKNTPANKNTEATIKHICQDLKNLFDDDKVSVDLCTAPNSSLFRLFGTKNWVQNHDGSLSSKPSYLLDDVVLPIQHLPKINLSSSHISPNQRLEPISPSINQRHIEDVEKLVYRIEQNIDLNIVYGSFLTGHTTPQGDLYCRDPFYDGSNNMGCVSTGGKYNRGRFFSFGTHQARSLVHFYQTLQGLNYIEACIQLSTLSGIQ